MVSTGVKVPVAVETYTAVRNEPVVIEAMEAAECWKVPLAVETNGSVMKVPMTVEGMVPNEPSMKEPMAIQAR